MEALDFLIQLEGQYRASGLHVSASLLRFALEPLKRHLPEKALESIANSKEFLISQMQIGPYETDLYAKDLALLNTLEQMIGGNNGK